MGKKGTASSLLALAMCVGAALSLSAASPTDAAARSVKLHCKVPSVVGRSLAGARARIRKAHCRVGKIVYKRSTKANRGRVLTQTPKAGRRLANNAKVNVTVGRAARR